MKSSNTALLIIDMINTLDFDQGEELLKHALPVAQNILKLRDKLQGSVPVIYVNDNFGQWRSSWEEVYEYCAQDRFPGHKISKLLKPLDDDYFILKPKHSGFFNTPLETLLKDLKVKKLIVTGVAGNVCILFTVNDAYMRGFEIHVPKNCIASNTKEENEFIIKELSDVFGIETSTVT